MLYTIKARHMVICGELTRREDRTKRLSSTTPGFGQEPTLVGVVEGEDTVI